MHSAFSSRTTDNHEGFCALNQHFIFGVIWSESSRVTLITYMFWKLVRNVKTRSIGAYANLPGITRTRTHTIIVETQQKSLLGAQIVCKCSACTCNIACHMNLQHIMIRVDTFNQQQHYCLKKMVMLMNHTLDIVLALSSVVLHD